MINDEMRPVTVFTFNSGLDDYGRIRKNGKTSRQVDMFIRIHNQYTTANPLFNEIDLIGLTKDNSISSSNQIQVDNVMYNVKYTIPSKRYNQVLMQKVK